jgi:hypothetical protein
MVVAKFLNGYIQFIKIQNTTRVHIHFHKLMPNTIYGFYIGGLCYITSSCKGELHSIFYDENMLCVNKK